jgi:hypothetical protein
MDWHLQLDESGDVFIHFQNAFYNLGPRDEAFTRFADFMGEDFTEREWIAPEGGGVAG